MKNGPPVLILNLQLTALATARCLADSGIHVDVAAFSRARPEARSKSIHVIDASHVPVTVDDVAEWVYQYASRTGEHPVVIPSGDTVALAIASHRHELEKVCTVWRTDYSELETIISKEGLYARAAAVGVRPPPSIAEPGLDELQAWCADNPGPYLVKPFYENIPTSRLTKKNLVLESAGALLDYVRKNGADSLVIQRLIRGGDGYVFDCYGLCDREFNVLTQASHARIRQSPINFGTTCYGEIPARSADFDEEKIFELNDRLLGGFKYHGIFGIEWIEDRVTRDLFVIDFNARPFLSIGHLYDCGLNLPLLAYQDLVYGSTDNVPLRPKLKHKFWFYLVHDCKTLRERLRNNEITVSGWLGSILKARSFACWRLNDPLPALHLLARYLKSLFGKGN
jgi:D-aspartate ligase